MAQWKEIVGLPFTAPALQEYAAGLKFTTWRPRFVVVHNTGVPNFADWHRYTGEQRMRGLTHYYRDEKGWSAGPHLFVADDFIWVFTPLTTSGVHSPSWNAFSWGVEIVGDYATEIFGGAVEANAVQALATLHETIGLDPQSMRPHRDDPLTTHQCPGRNLDIQKLRDDVGAELARRQGGEHRSEEMRAVIPADAASPRRKRARKKGKARRKK
jgi:hypothetical protein